MRTITLETQLPPELRGGAVAIGNFDGLHAGHRAVIEGARSTGQTKRPWLMATFDPTPRDLFAPDAPPDRIHTTRQRARVLERLGVDACVEIPFDLPLSRLTDQQFVDQVLVDRMGVSAVSVGFDFRFGQNRMGDTDALQEICGAHAITVHVVEEVDDEGGKLSSTRIRAALSNGDFSAARAQLGDWWTIDAVVEAGEKRGRTLGFPTANMKLGKLIQPPFGVYAVFAREAGATSWRPGVANFGRTPTTGLREPLLEVHLIDFHGDLYGKVMETAFVAFLRPEAHFPSIEELTEQMHTDRQTAKDVLAKAEFPL